MINLHRYYTQEPLIPIVNDSLLKEIPLCVIIFFKYYLNKFYFANIEFF